MTEPSKYIVDGAPENTELMSAYKFQKDVSGGNKLMENNLALVSHTHHTKKSVVKFLWYQFQAVTIRNHFITLEITLVSGMYTALNV